MFTVPAAPEIVYQISDEEQCKILQDHFNLLYVILAENHPIPDAVFERAGDIQRCYSGIPVPFHNAVLGVPSEKEDECIQEQKAFFQKRQMPFVWYVPEDTSPEFKAKLLEQGFQDGGIFKGVIGLLDKPIPSPEVSSDCTLERVESESAMEEFNDLVCDTFGIQGEAKGLFMKVMCEAAKNESHPMFHWLARKEGKAVSALSTLIKGDVVSFWNGASLPQMRRQGFSTALRRLALQDAISKRCRVGTSYLMSEGLAFGICSKLGFETKWRFHVFLSPGLSRH
jgi:hypothetical protein